MKHLIYSFLLLLYFIQLNEVRAQTMRPISSESMYNQLRSMEDGPWEFSPEGWYYSWYMKKIKLGFISFKTKVPGAGFHDRGPAGTGILGDGYVNKYKPSGKVRAQMIALTEISRKQYEAVEKKYKEIGDRESVDALDRLIDGSIKIYGSRIETIKGNIRSLCLVYDQYTGGNSSQFFREELSRIEDNISYIGKGYMRNAERSKAYLKEIKNLERLSLKIKVACKRAYLLNQASQIPV